MQCNFFSLFIYFSKQHNKGCEEGNMVIYYKVERKLTCSRDNVRSVSGYRSAVQAGRCHGLSRWERASSTCWRRVTSRPLFPDLVTLQGLLSSECNSLKWYDQIYLYSGSKHENRKEVNVYKTKNCQMSSGWYKNNIFTDTINL